MFLFVVEVCSFFFIYMAVGEWGCNKEKRCAETETGGLGATGAGWGQ